MYDAILDTALTFGAALGITLGAMLIGIVCWLVVAIANGW
jgi:hypothetical protein